MAETFQCPHCRHEYPRSPRLVGRPVRCRNCQLSFELGEDGTVTKVEVNARLEKTGRFRRQTPTVSSVLRAVDPASDAGGSEAAEVDPRARTATDDGQSLVERLGEDLDEDGVTGRGRHRKKGRIVPHAPAPAPAADPAVDQATSEVPEFRPQTIRMTAATDAKEEDLLRCPHCGHAYPRSQKLIDRPVRCRACRDNFIVRSDWVVEKVRVSQRFTRADAGAAASAPVSAPVPAPTDTAPPPPAAAPPPRMETIREVSPTTAAADETVACPHCGESYPRNPRLIDKPVRCRQCRNGFIVRQGWLVEAVRVSQRFERVRSGTDDKESKQRELAQKMRQALASVQSEAAEALTDMSEATTADRRIKRTTATSVGRIATAAEPAAEPTGAAAPAEIAPVTPATEPSKSADESGSITVDGISPVRPAAASTPTFTCPHCGVTFPVREDLVGTPTKCTTCGGGFVLQADGRALPVGKEPDTQQRLRPRPAGGTTDSQRTGRSGRTSSASDRHHPTRKSGITGKQEQMRQEMSRRLRDRAAATESDPVPRGENQASTAPRTASASRSGVSTSHRMKREKTKKEDYQFKHAVLSGEGRILTRRFLIAKAILIVLLLPFVLHYLLTMDFSPERQALQDYGRPSVIKSAWEWPSLSVTLRQRCWVYDHTMPLIIGLDGANLLPSRSIELRPVGDLLRGYMRLGNRFLLVLRTDRERAEQAITGANALLPPQVQQALRAAEIPFLVIGDLSKVLREQGMTERDAAIVGYLLAGPNRPDGACELLDAVLQYGPPARLDLIPFRGQDGYEMQDRDSRYVHVPCRFTGLLMRIADADWLGRTGRVTPTGAASRMEGVSVPATSITQRESPLPWDIWRVLHLRVLAPHGGQDPHPFY